MLVLQFIINKEQRTAGPAVLYFRGLYTLYIAYLFCGHLDQKQDDFCILLFCKTY